MDDATTQVDILTVEAHSVRGGALERRVIRKGASSSESRAAEPVFIRGIDRSIQPAYNPSELVQLLELSVVHSRCVQTKAADTIGNYDLVAEDNTASDAKPPDKLTVWLKQSGIVKVLRRVMVDYEATGNGYMEITYVGKVPYQVNHLSSYTMRLADDPQGGRQRLFVQRFYPGTQVAFFKQPGDDRKICAAHGLTGSPHDGEQPASTCVRFEEYSPLDYWYGVPGWLPALANILGTASAERYNYYFFANNCLPSYAVIAEGGQLAKDAKDEIKSFLGKSKGNAANGNVMVISVPATEGKPGVPPNTVKVNFQKLQADMRDGSFRLYLEQNALSIARAHGVPPSRIGIHTAGALGSGDVTAEETKNYSDGTIEPRQEMVEEIINHLIVEQGFGITGWRVEFANVSQPDDVKGRSETADINVNNGTWNRQEAREYIDTYTSKVEGAELHTVMTKSGPILISDLETAALANAAPPADELTMPEDEDTDLPASSGGDL